MAVHIRLLAALLVTAQLTAAVNYMYDEYLYSKDTWRSWKIDNPLEDVNPTSEASTNLKALLPHIEGSEFNSLDGPFARRDGSASPRCV